MGFVHHDHMVEQVAPTTLNPPLSDAILPGTFEGSPDRGQPTERTAIGTSNPYFLSRSKIENLGADWKGKASRSCWITHALVGCRVTLKWRIRRRL